MRILLAVTVSAFAIAASAQSTERPRPPGSVPLEDIAPPPPLPPMTKEELAAKNSTAEPVVTRREENGQVIEEYRVKGRMYMQRVTPKVGRPYILVDNKGDGTFTKQDNTIDGGHFAVPQWVLMEF